MENGTTKSVLKLTLNNQFNSLQLLRGHGIVETDCFGRASLAKSVFKKIVIITKNCSKDHINNANSIEDGLLRTERGPPSLRFGGTGY